MEKIESPCIQVCKLKNNYCIGCLRTINEIKHWKDYTADARKVIIKQLENRKGG